MSLRDGPAHNTRSRSHSMPGGMPTTSPDELEIGPSTMPTVEDTTRKPAEQSEKPITGSTKVQRVLKISQHPLFDKENHPTEGANTLVELQDDINDDEYGPWWFEFLSWAMDYDRRLFDRSYKTEQSLKRMRNDRNQAIKERDDAIQDRDNAIQEKENTIQEHSNVRELLSSAQLEVERLLQENKILTSRLPSQQHENRGRSHSRISSVSHSPSQDLTSFGKKPHHREHRNRSYSRVRHPRSQWRSRSRSRSHIRVYPRNRSHSRSRVDRRDRSRGRDDSLARMTWNMMYSLVQQVMRQDPFYYRHYVLLRPDHDWRLISYPYYTKYTVPGDSTAFSHIDINITRALDEGRGVAMIQGSVSVDDEDDQNCTKILPTMHKQLRPWWNLVKERGLAKDGYIHVINSEMFTSADKEQFHTDWSKVPCGSGDARITSS